MQNDVQMNIIWKCLIRLKVLFAESKRNAVKRANTSDVKDYFNVTSLTTTYSFNTNLIWGNLY